MAFPLTPTRLDEYGETYQDESDPLKYKTVLRTGKQRVLDPGDGTYKAYLDTTVNGNELEVISAKLGKIRGDRVNSRFSVLDGRMLVRVQTQRWNGSAFALIDQTLQDATVEVRSAEEFQVLWTYETTATGQPDLRVRLRIQPGQAKWSYQFRAPETNLFRQRVQVMVPDATNARIVYRKNVPGNPNYNGEPYMCEWLTPDGILQYNFIDMFSDVGNVSLNPSTFVLSVTTGDLSLALNDVITLDPTFGPSDTTYSVDCDDGGTCFYHDEGDWHGYASYIYYTALQFSVGSITSGNTIDSVDLDTYCNVSSGFGSNSTDIGPYNDDGTGDLSTDNGVTRVSRMQYTSADYLSSLTDYRTTGAKSHTLGSTSTDDACVDLQAIRDASGTSYTVVLRPTVESGEDSYAGIDEDNMSNPATLTVVHSAAGTTINASVDTIAVTAYAATVQTDTNISASADAVAVTPYAAVVTNPTGTDITATTDTIAVTAYTASLFVEVETNIGASLATIAVTPQAASIIAETETNISASLDTIAVATYAATVVAETETNIAASVDTVAVTAYQATIVAETETNIAASVDTIAVTTYAATVQAATNISATTDTIAVTAYAAAVSTGLNIAASVDTIAVTPYAAAVQTNTDISATLDTIAVTAYQASVALGLNISASLDTIAVTAYAGSVQTDTNISATTDTIAVATYAATVQAATNISATTDTIAVTAYQASVSVGLSISATTDTIAVTGFQAGVNANKDISASADTIAVTGLQASVNANKDISATTATIAITEYAAVVNAEKNISAIADTISVTPYAAVVSANQPTEITATTDSITLTTYAAMLITGRPGVIVVKEITIEQAISAMVNVDQAIQAELDVIVPIGAKINVTNGV